MGEDQGALFGDLDGLFATIETVPVTPVDQIRFVRPDELGAPDPDDGETMPDPDCTRDARCLCPDCVTSRRTMFAGLGRSTSSPTPNLF